MTEIQLGYGKRFLDFTFDENRYQILSHNSKHEEPLSDAEIGYALSTPIQSAALEDIFSSGDSVLIVVSDATRATASAQILNLTVRRLIQTGVSPADLTIIFATGIHRTVTAEEKIELLTPFIAQRIRTIDHSALDASQIISLGTTDRGTAIEVNRALKDYSHVIITGAIGFHYFAGFTGGRKSICPGLASASTIEATHMLALDFQASGRRAGVGTGVLHGNAVHEECERVANLVAPCFGINSVVDERGRAVRIYAGDWRAAHYKGCSDYLSSHSVSIDKKWEIVIASCGGSPYDLNLIQAHKALDMAAHACVDGGTIILLAECGDGLGNPSFLKWFDEPDSKALEKRLRSEYEVSGQTAWSLLMKAELYRVVLISELPDDKVRKMRMIPARWNEAVKEASGKREGCIMPYGSRFLPRIGSPAQW